MAGDSCFQFIGYYVSFSTDSTAANSEMLKSILDFVGEERLGHVRYGRLTGRLASSTGVHLPLGEILDGVQKGTIDHAVLTTRERPGEWRKYYSEGRFIQWDSWRFGRSEGPVAKRFGVCGHAFLTFPTSLFQRDGASQFQRQLLAFAKIQFRRSEVHWAFVNLGQRPIGPAIIGSDEVFLSTRQSVPVTAFDADLTSSVVGFFREYVKGAFWVNFLNPQHLASLGGETSLMRLGDTVITERLGGGRYFVQVGPTPLMSDTPEARAKFQTLRKAFGPILIETPQEVDAIQRRTIAAERKSNQSSE